VTVGVRVRLKASHVTTKRLFEIFELLAQHEREGHQDGALSVVAAQITNMSGAGIALTSAEALIVPMSASDSVARQLLDIEVTLHEGPCVDSLNSASAVASDDLSRAGGVHWPGYAPEAQLAGAQAVFAFPLVIGAIRFGALNLYREHPGPLEADQSIDAYLMASVVGRAILAMQAGAGDGELSSEFEDQSTLNFVVHQAAGMVSVQAKVPLRDALVALRAHAFAISESITSLSNRVVGRDIFFNDADRLWHERGGET
jgi:hypothetical protein